MNWDTFIEVVEKGLAVVALVLLNGFFVAAELALVRIRATQLDTLAARGHRQARRARHIIQNINAYIGATQLGITLASLALGVAVEPVFRHLLEPVFSLLDISSAEVRKTVAIGVGFLVNSYLLIVAGELAPKAIAIRRTLQTVLFVSTPLVWFYRLSFPFIWSLNHSAQWLLRRLGIESADETEHGHSEEELRLLLSSAQKISGATAPGRYIEHAQMRLHDQDGGLGVGHGGPLARFGPATYAHARRLASATATRRATNDPLAGLAGVVRDRRRGDLTGEPRMKLPVLMAGVATIALTAGAAAAASHHHHHAAKGESAGAYAPPAQPVAYSKLDAYLKASPKERARGDWGADTANAAAAQTGTAANAAASPAPNPSADTSGANAGAQDQPQGAQPPADQSGAAGSSATPPASPDATTPAQPQGGGASPQ